MQDLEGPEQPMGPDALLKSIGKKHRHRSGYEAGVSMLAKTVSALEFVRSADPMPTLGSVTSILLTPPVADAAADEEDGGESDEEEGDGKKGKKVQLGGEEATELILEQKETDAEVKELCKDVQVCRTRCFPISFAHCHGWSFATR